MATPPGQVGAASSGSEEIPRLPCLSLAPSEGSVPSIQLCEFCEEVVARILSHTRSSDQSFDRYSFDRSTSLAEAAHHCHLCQKIEEFVTSSLDEEVHEDWRQGKKINLRLFFDLVGRLGSAQLSIATPERERKGSRSWSWIHLAVWQDKTESNNCGHIRPGLNHDPEDLIWLVQPWIQNCLDQHDSCRKTLAGKTVDDIGGPPLPTRVIQVNLAGKPRSVRLVETQGQRGRYCALSYCWGPPENEQYRTLKSNVDGHLNEIPLSVLPKTLRDAIKITRVLGIEYLWIDSLCIIQDEAYDWEEQAKMMGTLYGQAFLVLVAAGAPSSDHGMLSFSGVFDSKVLLPGKLQSNKAEAFINIAPFDLEPSLISPEHGPLIRRAWARQEWHLARRLLFVMPGGCSWFCQDSGEGLHEWGWYHDFRTQTVPRLLRGYLQDWLWFLSEYSESDLTKQSDRLVALSGISEEFQTESLGRYSLGMWEEELEVQLLWYRDRYKPWEDLDELPSWCWAALGGRSTFADEVLDVSHRTLASAVFLTGGLRIAINGTLSRVSKWDEGRQDRLCCEITLLELQADSSDRNDSGWVYSHSPIRGMRWSGSSCNDRNSLRWSGFCNGRNSLQWSAPVGTVVLDDLDDAMECEWYILPLVSAEASDAQKESRAAMLDEAIQEEYRSCCVCIIERAQETPTIWALLITPDDEIRGSYKRLGIALMFQEEAGIDFGSRKDIILV